jgi:c-di-GMP-binding flagellar brake protein YcgR
MNQEYSNNRRVHKRYSLDGGGFALIQTDNAEIVGSIRDISAGGICVTHINGDTSIPEHAPLVINLISENAYNDKFRGVSRWSCKEEGGFSTSMVNMKRCGIQFENLSNKMQDRLNTFIDTLI